jgi:hypothetical protein
MLPLLFAPPVSAQRDAAPTFGLQAPATSCPGADPGYTCNSTAQVTGYSPTYCGTGCHYEYCFATTVSGTYAVCSEWRESVPTSAISLGTGLGDGSTATIYSEYRFVEGTTISQPSQYGTASITVINMVPAVDVNSPAGVLGTNVTTGDTQFNAQLINGYVGQYVTYHAAAAAGTVSVSFEPCILLPSSCGSSVNLPETQFIDPPAPATYTLPSVWGWVDPGTVTYSYNYVYLVAEDEAGNTNNTGTPGSAPFTLFNGSTTTENKVCSPTACTDLADGTGENGGAGDMPSDPPSGAVGGSVFAGYADPTMRADTLVTADNPNGTNLWLGYSWPLIQTFSHGTGEGMTIAAVESHLAQSPTAGAANGGDSWTAWCSGAGCSGYTAIYPSVEFGDGHTEPDHFSSHEVLNLWPYIVQPSSANSYVGTETWYAAHLMYYRYYSDPLTLDIQTYGCLVVATTNPSQNTQDSPGQLAWSSGPDACTDTPPSNSVFLSWGTLNTASGQSCASWGEPAIMVSADGGTVYLAAACFDSSFVGTGYWIFTVPTSDMLTEGDWTSVYETFSYSDLPSSLQTYLGGNYTYLMEFDWAIRADSSIVAVVTPAGTHTQKQFGCVILNFFLESGTTTPFGSFWATVTDTDTNVPMGFSEGAGPNGCTYEPTSNNGVVIVRSLTNSSSSIQTYSLVNTGLIP